MSEEKKEEKDYIILVYKSFQKQIPIPSDFNSLESKFLELFNEDKNKVFCYHYFDEDGEICEINKGMENTDFISAIGEIREKDRPI